MQVIRGGRSALTFNAWARALRVFASARGHVRGPVSDLNDRVMSNFTMFLIHRKKLASSTVNRYIGDLRKVRDVVFNENSSGLMELVRSALARSGAIPNRFRVSVPVSTLLHTVEHMPTGTITQRRDRVMAFCAVIMAARPADITSMARGNTGLLSITKNSVRVRFVQDKGSRLSGRPVSPVIVVPRHQRLDFGRELQGYLDAISNVPYYPTRPLAGNSPLFPCLDDASQGKPLERQTVSKILKRFLESAGAPEEMRARDIRASVSSSAIELDCRREDVCRHCRWKNIETFEQFYYRTDTETPILQQLRSRDGSGVPMACLDALEWEFPSSGAP